MACADSSIRPTGPFMQMDSDFLSLLNRAVAVAQIDYGQWELAMQLLEQTAGSTTSREKADRFSFWRESARH